MSMHHECSMHASRMFHSCMFHSCMQVIVHDWLIHCHSFQRDISAHITTMNTTCITFPQYSSPKSPNSLLVDCCSSLLSSSSSCGCIFTSSVPERSISVFVFINCSFLSVFPHFWLHFLLYQRYQNQNAF